MVSSASRRVSGRVDGMAPEASVYCTGETHMRQKYDLFLEHSFVVLRLPQIRLVPGRRPCDNSAHMSAKKQFPTPPRRVALFVTCMVDMIYPEVGMATVELLERHGVEVVFPAEQTCCGQPTFNAGYWDEARTLARRFVDIFEPLVRTGKVDAIVAPSGSCTAMVTHGYELLFAEEPAYQTRVVDPRVRHLRADRVPGGRPGADRRRRAFPRQGHLSCLLPPAARARRRPSAAQPAGPCGRSRDLCHWQGTRSAAASAGSLR